ncbi:hypothetical protein DSM106972_057150 [Dulcicalothrix desertica PCC 7102]|uniref:Uncharacterized protein n=1 Tax=Dulcicalothrix desertica PCC 7102 TaxID=232991 RepID=A0A3S1C9D7_9CYAN|nr:hypothetical protein [Dulcicalothrix desertica]RUT02795.1 hypothetical protein DSM106972_057150 [Dulcicalothrix desertica PCC 7102]TWH38971.1 hypothetical protein CAL7102_08174 [Dulcicalothrix desertica PCC 7102]
MQFSLKRLFKFRIFRQLGIKLAIFVFLAFVIFPLSPCFAQEIAQQPDFSIPIPGNFRLPNAGTNFIPSRFDIDLEILSGPNAGRRLILGNLTDIMVVSRSNPMTGNETSARVKFDFKDQNGEGEKFSRLDKLRKEGITLDKEVRKSDFSMIPEGFRDNQARKIFVEIASIDASSADGSSRILVGQPLKNMFPQIYKPALGMIVMDGNRKYPARSFFIPYGVIMTKYGNFIANANGYENPIYAFATPPTRKYPNIPVDLEEEGESYRAVERSQLVSLDNPSGPPVARLNQVRFTNATIRRRITGELDLEPPERQPIPKPFRGERFTNSKDPKDLFPSE